LGQFLFNLVMNIIDKSEYLLQGQSTGSRKLPSIPRLYSRLFVIDDDTEDQQIFAEAVSEVDESIQVFTSTSGDDAIKQLESELLMLPDLIFLDLNIPKQNGKQILQRLKSHRSLKTIPVIMYSTSFGARDIEEIRKIGASHYLTKPARFDELCKSLRSILSKQWQ
jgi:DNA-binding response OmpR family regulator